MKRQLVFIALLLAGTPLPATAQILKIQGNVAGMVCNGSSCVVYGSSTTGAPGRWHVTPALSPFKSFPLPAPTFRGHVVTASANQRWFAGEIRQDSQHYIVLWDHLGGYRTISEPKLWLVGITNAGVGVGVLSSGPTSSPLFSPVAFDLKIVTMKGGQVLSLGGVSGAGAVVGHTSSPDEAAYWPMTSAAPQHFGAGYPSAIAPGGLFAAGVTPPDGAVVSWNLVTGFLKTWTDRLGTPVKAASIYCADDSGLFGGMADFTPFLCSFQLGHCFVPPGNQGDTRAVIGIGRLGNKIAILTPGPNPDGASPSGFVALLDPTEAGAGFDTTPPLITPDVAGPPPADGWYTGDITVTWKVHDPESSVAATEHCEPRTISADTRGTLLKCKAYNSAGFVRTTPLLIQLDKTPPDIQVTTTGVNPAGWAKDKVRVSFSGSDGTSGLSSCTRAVLLSGEGAQQEVRGQCVDRVGNTGHATARVNIDKTPPAVSAEASPRPNQAGWNNTPVTIHFQGRDTLSGIEQCDRPLTLRRDGVEQSAAGACHDRAGNSAAAVVRGIRIDTAAPEIAGIPGTRCIVPAGERFVTRLRASDSRSGLDPASFKVSVAVEPPAPAGRELAFVTPGGPGTIAVTLAADQTPRTYTLTATAADAAGNIATRNAVCQSPVR